MKRLVHPGYTPYLQALDTSHDIRKAVESWKASGDEIEVPQYELSWSPNSAQKFIRRLGAIFQAYNRTLWDVFPYCTLCQGGCCLTESPHISRFDLLALALLKEAFPLLPENSQVRGQVCVYLYDARCSWPAAWRTLKCWTFYCLGGVGWQLSDPHDTRYRQLAEALEVVLLQDMPPELITYEQVTGQNLTSNLIDPLHFAEALDHTLEEIFVQPFATHYPLPFSPSTRPAPLSGMMPEGEVFAFFVEIMEQIEVEEPVADEQILVDLETLEMFLLGRSHTPQPLLDDMETRYLEAEIDTIEYKIGELVGKLNKKRDG